jgi:D-alanyl-D-alanine carboxypeptidase/D-alanyl-D-alanine-endopeptidase (penicillin-binding protein 4)
MRVRSRSFAATRCLSLLLATLLTAADGRSQPQTLAKPATETSPAAAGNTAAGNATANAERRSAQLALDALAVWVREHKGTLSAHALDVGDGTPLFTLNQDLPLNPASTMKLVTAAVALDVLGPDFTYQTGLYGAITDGKCGRLVLRGHGDPSLAEATLWRLANSLSNQGLTEVGELLVDQSAFDEQWVPPGFAQQPGEWAAFRAPVSAISLEQNTITVNVQPATAGVAARVWLEPAGVGLVAGTVQTTDRGKGERIQLEMVPPVAAPGAQPNATPRLTARVSGSVGEGLGRLRFGRRLDDPRLAPGLNLAELLRQRGVKVGPVSLGGADVQTRLTFASSATLAELLRSLGKDSDNFYAETIFKSLARASSADPASSQAAAAIVTRWLEQSGSLPPGTRIGNGSGLFDSNRLSASTLTRVLTVAAARPRLAPEFIAQLAIGGTDGTLRSRFRRSRDERSVRAKTGTLDDSIALAGYLLRDAKTPLGFAIIVNGISGHHGELRNKVDDVVMALSAR